MILIPEQLNKAASKYQSNFTFTSFEGRRVFGFGTLEFNLRDVFKSRLRHNF
jgi:hypothetical protein